MKRTLTIGCVLLVGGGVTHCGGSVETSPAEQQAAQAGASGSGAPTDGFVGDNVTRPGAGGGFVGNVVSHAGASSVPMGVAPIENLGVGGDPGEWEGGIGAGSGPIAGEGGVAGWNEEQPPGVGTAPLGGTGGAWMGVPPK